MAVALVKPPKETSAPLPIAVFLAPVVLLASALTPVAVLVAPMITLGSEIFGVVPPLETNGAEAVTVTDALPMLSQLTVPFSLTAWIALPGEQVPVMRNWTCAELTSTAATAPSAIWAEVTPPGAILIVPDVVIGPPVRPDPVSTLVTALWHTTVPSRLIWRMDDPTAQPPVTRSWKGACS